MNASNIKADLRASIVVFLVALPLAMGIAVASGFPPVSGLITGIIGGIVVGMMAGAPLQVSGAAAGLTVVVYQGVQQFGIERMGFVIMAAGLMQLAAASVGLGRWFRAVSPTVLYAMLAGIGVLIVAGQAHVLLDQTPLGGGLTNLAALPERLWAAVTGAEGAVPAALGLGVLSVGLMAAWPKIAKGRLALLPAPLIAVVVCAAVAFLTNAGVAYVRIPDNLFQDMRIGWDLSLLKQDLPALLGAAIQLALIASAESLLCAAAVDQLHSGERARLDKELGAQGIGNMLCGLVGALPMTGVIVRSSANVSAGGKTRLSTILHGIWLLAFVGVFPFVLAYVPVSALAGILVFTGVKLVNVKEIKLLARQGKSELGIYAATVGVIVGYDLLAGVLLGLALSSMKVLRQLSHLSVSVMPDHEAKRCVVSMSGAATFLRLPKLVVALEKVPEGSTVELAVDLKLMDTACRQHLESWQARHEQLGGRIARRA